MTEIDRIADQIERAYRADAWSGPSLLEALADVDAEQAAAKPLSSGHSIWELVLHVAGWKDTVRRRLQGENIATPVGGDWPPVNHNSASAWHEALSLLETRHQELMTAVRAFGDDRLGDVLITEQSRETGGGQSAYTQLHGIAQHDLYHAGQVSLLKKSGAN